jgi:long-chain acyl-CoA synthetase
MYRQVSENFGGDAENLAAIRAVDSAASTYGNVAACLLRGKVHSKVAIESVQGSWTYGDLESASHKLASFLLSLGANQGDRVILVADNSFFWIVSYLAILRAGLVCVPLPPSLSSNELTAIIESSGALLSCVDERYYVRNANQLPQTCIINQSSLPSGSPQDTVHIFDQILRAEVGQAEFPPTLATDLAALMFTSGSTRKPRGVMVSHGNILANACSIVEYLGLTENDSILNVLPFHYCFGTSVLHTHLMVGGKLVLDNRFMFTESFLQQLQNSQCTGFAGVPSHFQILLRRSNMHQIDFPHLRYVQQAGGHLAPAFIRELREALPHTQVFVMYGQTEATARLAYVQPEMLDKKIGSIGKAIPGVKLSIVNAQGAIAGIGEMGEIVAEGSNITMGYWEHPEETASTFRGRKLYTGDIARIDEDGYIYIVDRAGDFIKVGGKRTNCRDLEEQMLEFTPLLEVAIVAIPDPISGEAIKAFIVPRDPKANRFPEDFRLFCTAHLSPHHIPKEIVQLDALPKNSSGKVMKSELKSVIPVNQAIS